MNKITLSLLSSVLLGSVIVLPAAAMDGTPRVTPHGLERMRGPLAARFADRYSGPGARAATKKSGTRTRAQPGADYTVIDEPDADPGLYGTRVFFINESDQISGQYMDSAGVYHAFLCTFPACKASEDFTVVSVNGGDTFGFVVNDKGEWCGSYVDNDTGVENTWVRNPKTGKVETVVIGTAGTFCQGLNNRGLMTGNYLDDNGATHGFLRAKDGSITTFDDPSGGTGTGQGTNPIYINDKGVVSGIVFDSNNVAHGFLYFPNDHEFTDYDVPGAGSGDGQGTLGLEIEDNGWVTGTFIDSNDVTHGFLRSPDGDKVITVDPPDGGTGPGQGVDLNSGHLESGWDVGDYIDSDGMYHGFFCKHCTNNGKIVEFDAPGADDLGTYTVYSSNRDHVIVGTFKDDNAIRHGFVRQPK